MRDVSRRAWLLTALLLIVGISAALGVRRPAPKQVVVVTGKGAGTGEAARDEALRDAMRRAVERVAVKLYSETHTKNYVTVLDRVLARAQGYVTDHRIIRETVEDGVTVLKVKVTVATQTVVDDWGAIQVALETAGKPRLLIVSDDTVDGDLSPQFITEFALTQYLTNKGFPIVDHRQLKEISIKEMKAARAAGDLGRVAKIASQYNGEIVLVGEAIATYGGTLDIAGVTVRQYAATMRLKAVRTDTAEVLTSVDAIGRASNMNRGGAAEESLKKAAREVGKKLVKGIMVRWRDESFGGSALTVVITKANFTGLDRLMGILKTTKGVSSVVQRTFRGGTAELEVTTTKTPRRMAQLLESLDEVKLSVQEMTARRIVAAFEGLGEPASQPAGE